MTRNDLPFLSVLLALLLSLAIPQFTPAFAADTDEAELIASYTAAWKSLLADASGISVADLEPIIEVKKAEIQEWNSGRDFRVSYLVKCGWLTSEAQDQLMVWIHQKEDAYRHVALPRDTWFTMADLKLAVSKRVFNTQLGRVDAKAKPFFASLDEAREFIKKKYGLVSITRDEVRYYVPGKLPRTDGAPYLCWWATIDDAANRGRQGHLNLITGTDESYENAIRHYAEPDNDASPVPTRATPTAIPHRKGE